MKNNVINSRYGVSFGQTGSLTILGKFPDYVLMMVEGDQASGLDGLSRQEFMQDQLLANSVENGNTIFVFKYKLTSELRNPQKLLKSVRNKIMGAIRQDNIDFAEEMREMDEMYTVPDREEHRMFR